jgi:hypothetical protein
MYVNNYFGKRPSRTVSVFYALSKYLSGQTEKHKKHPRIAWPIFEPGTFQVQV